MGLGKGCKTLAEVFDILTINFDGIECACPVDEGAGECTTTWTNFENSVVRGKLGTLQDLLNNGRIL
jgi:hypothetical protein